MRSLITFILILVTIPLNAADRPNVILVFIDDMGWAGDIRVLEKLEPYEVSRVRGPMNKEANVTEKAKDGERLSHDDRDAMDVTATAKQFKALIG